MTIDIDFHIGTDTPPGKDPDTYSPTVARYHIALWSKPLPNGQMFDLEAPNMPPFYLHHHSELGPDLKRNVDARLPKQAEHWVVAG